MSLPRLPAIPLAHVQGEKEKRGVAPKRGDRSSTSHLTFYQNKIILLITIISQNRISDESWPCFVPRLHLTIWKKNLVLNIFSPFVGFVLLRSDSLFPFLLGIIVLGIAHHTITVKGSHQASHNSLTESKSWGKSWAIFFIEVSSQRLLLITSGC